MNISEHEYVVFSCRSMWGVTRCYHVLLYIGTNSGKSAEVVCKIFKNFTKVPTCD